MNDTQLTLIEKSFKRAVATRNSFLRFIVSLSGVIFGIVVSLGIPSVENTLCIRRIFAGSVAAIGLGFLFGCIALYEATHYALAEWEKRQELYCKGYAISPMPSARVYEVCEKVCYIFFSLSIIGFVSYVIAICLD